MAKDILYIADGATIDAAWTGHVVISGDGVNWDAIPKHTGLFVGKHAININTSVPNSYPERGEIGGFVVTLKISDETSPKLSFNPAKVLNQPTWVVPGAADANAGAIQAMRDILTWLG